MLSDFSTWFAQNIGWTIIHWMLAALVMSAFTTAAINNAFGLLASWRQKIWFFVLTVVSLGLLISIIQESRPKAILKAAINYLAIMDSGAPPGALATITIVNGGNAQSVVLGLTLKTTIDGHIYIGVPVTLPEKFTVTAAGQNITYYGKDSLVSKLSDPIPAGGEQNGVAGFVFPEATISLLNRPAKYILSFADAFGHTYETEFELKSGVQSPMVDLPGVKQEIGPPSLSPTPLPTTK
jgi:hypothetical protein